MPIFDVRFTFTMMGETTCLTIEAENEEDALRKCKLAIDGRGFFDSKKFEELGGDASDEGWNACAGTDYDYDIDLDGIQET